MASSADLEYLRRQRARKQANQAGGTQILQNSGDAIEKTGEDATWTALASGQVQQQPQQQGQDRNAWQRIWDTERDISNNIARGALNFFDGILDMGAWALGLFGNDEWKQGVRDFMNYDWQSQAIAYGNQWSPVNAIMTGDLFNNNYWDRWFAIADNERAQANEALTAQQSYQGEWGKAGEYAKQAEQAVGYMLPNIFLFQGKSPTAATKALSMGMLGASAFGSGTAEALNDGADYYQAGLSGAISSGIEMGTELASAGIGKGLGKLFGEGVSFGSHIGGASMGKQLGKFSLKEIGQAAIEEGMEEVASDLLSPFTKLPYKGTEAFAEYSDPELYEGLLGSFIGGAAGGIFGSVTNTAHIKSKYGEKGVAVTQYLEQLNEAHAEATAEAQKGDSADPAKLAKLEERVGAIVKDIATNLDEMKADESAKGKAYYENLIEFLKDPRGTMRQLADEGDVIAQTYLSNHTDIVEKMGRSAYERLADSFSNDNVSYNIGTAEQFESTDRAFIKNGREIFINPKNVNEFYALVGHEAIGHAYIDTEPAVRERLVRNIEADEALNEILHKDDADIARTYSTIKKPALDSNKTYSEEFLLDYYNLSKETFRSEQLAHFIERFIRNNNDIQKISIFQDNASLRGKMRSLLTKVKTWLQAKMGNDSAKAIRQINKAIASLDVRAEDAEQAPAIAYAKTKKADTKKRKRKAKDNYGYHAGDLGKADSYSDMQGRGTGHFGTGTYFVGDESLLGDYNSRDGEQAPHHKIDFSDYNLFRPSDLEEGRKLHKSLQAINDSGLLISDSKFTENIESFDRLYANDSVTFDNIENINLLNDAIEARNKLVKGKKEQPIKITSKKSISQADMALAEEAWDRVKKDIKELKRASSQLENLEDAMDVLSEMFGKEKVAEALDKVGYVYKNYEKEGGRKNTDSKNWDSLSTIFMKALGYEGVDVRGIDRLDNTNYGSVIYDLKETPQEAPKPQAPKVEVEKDTTNVPESYTAKDADGKPTSIKSWTYSSVSNTMQNIAVSVLKNTKIAEKMGRKLSDYRITFNEQSRAKATDTLFELLNKKNVTTEEISQGIADMLNSMGIAIKGERPITLSAFINNDSAIESAIDIAVSKHIADLIKLGKADVELAKRNKMRIQFQAQLNALNETLKEVRKNLTAKIQDTRKKINSTVRLHDFIKNHRRILSPSLDVTINNEIMRMGKILADPIIKMDRSGENGYKTVLHEYQEVDGKRKKVYTISLREGLTKALESYTEEAYAEKNAKGELQEVPLFPYSQQLRDAIVELRDSLPSEPKETKNGVQWPTLTGEQSKALANITDMIAHLANAAASNARAEYIPLSRGGIMAIDSAKDHKWVTKFTSNVYTMDYASMYLTANSMFAGSQLGIEMTVKMDQAYSEKEKFVYDFKKIIADNGKNVLGSITKTVKYKGIKLTRGELMDMYASLRANSNHDNLDRNGMVARNEEGASVIFKGELNGESSAEFMEFLDDTLTDDEKKFADDILKLYNSEEVRKVFVEIEKRNGVTDVVLLDEYYPTMVQGDTYARAEAMMKALFNFGYEKKRVKHNKKFAATDIVSRAVSFIDAIGTMKYVYPQYNKVVNALNVHDANGRNVWGYLDESKFARQAEVIKTMLDMYMGVDPRKGTRGRLSSTLMSAYTKSLLVANPGTPLRQLISALYSNFGVAGVAKSIIDKSIFGNKEKRALLKQLSGEFEQMALRGVRDPLSIPKHGIGAVFYALGKITDIGMKPVTFTDRVTVNLLLMGSINVVESCGYTPGTTEFKGLVKDFFSEAVMTQIGTKPTNLSMAVIGKGKLGPANIPFNVFSGPARAALAATSDRLKTASIVNERGLTEDGVKANLKLAQETLEKVEQAQKIAKDKQTKAQEVYNDALEARRDAKEALDKAKGMERAAAEKALAEADKALQTAESALEDANEEQRKLFDSITEANLNLQQAKADRHIFMKYKAMGGKKWALNSLLLMIIAAIFNATIADFASRATGKKRWQDGIEFGFTKDGELNTSSFSTTAVLYLTFGWMPVVNTLSNAIFNNYDISYPTGAVIENITDLGSTFKSLIENGNEKTAKNFLRSVLDTVSKMTGLPIRNVYNLVYGTLNSIDQGLGESLRGMFYTTYGTTSSDITEALKKNDMREVNRLVGKQFSERVGEISEAVRNEIVSLYKEDVTVAPPSISSSYTDADGNAVTISWTNQQEIRKVYSKANAVVAKAITRATYQALEASERGYIIQAIYNAFRQGGYHKVLGDKYTGQMSKLGILASSGNSSVGEIISAVAYIRTLTATATKTKKQLAIAYVNRLKLAKNDKLLVLHLAGYSVDTSAVTASLRSKGLSKEDITAIVN